MKMNNVNDLVKATEANEDRIERQFEYVVNDRALKTKFSKGAKRPSIEIVQNSNSCNMIFNLGAWNCTVIPVLKHWNNMKGTSIDINQTVINVTEVKTGTDLTGKSIDTQVIFYMNNEKVVLHCYNTTQLILINGVGYLKFLELFLRPFFEEKVRLRHQQIEKYNTDALEFLKLSKVKRSEISLPTISSKRLLSFTPLRSAKKAKQSPIKSAHKPPPIILNEDATIIEEHEDFDPQGVPMEPPSIPECSDRSFCFSGDRQGQKLEEISSSRIPDLTGSPESPKEGVESAPKGKLMQDQEIITLEEECSTESFQCDLCQLFGAYLTTCSM